MSQAFSYTQPYTEEHVTQDLSAKALLFIELMLNQAKQNKDYGEQIATKNALQRFGFSNSQNAKMLGEYTAAADTLAFMEEVRRKFGKEAMLVRYDHFFEILEKYDMVCGSFYRYTGTIPQKDIETLNRLAEMWERKEFSERYGLNAGHPCQRTYFVNAEAAMVQSAIKQMRMYIVVGNHDAARQIQEVTGSESIPDGCPDKLEGIGDALLIAAPAADMEPLSVHVSFYTERLYKLRQLEASVVNIKAEEERLKDIFRASDINRYAKIDFISEEPEIVRILRDPFICSLTKYGVLIHAKWGAEAEDATIKRYEQLRNAVIGK